ncbi:MAG: hypothetical protein ACLF0G_06200, partial [Candidatus Brocadiia bacterium]
SPNLKFDLYHTNLWDRTLVQFRKTAWRRLLRKLIRLVGVAAPRRRSARWLATLYAVREQ